MSERRGFDAARFSACADVKAVSVSPIDQQNDRARQNHPIQFIPTALPRNANKTFPCEPDGVV
jgi:hypothetical protein